MWVRPMPKRRILVIDDEPGLTQLLRFHLEQAGLYEVQEEHQAAQALATARAFQPQLILLDLIMPDLGGDEVADQLKADPHLSHIPIVFLTAMPKPKEVAAKGGMIDGYSVIAKPVSSVEGWVEKPFGVQELLEKVAQLLKESHAQ